MIRSIDTVAIVRGKIFGDFRFKVFCGCHIGTATRSVALLFYPRKPAAVKCACHLRFYAQRRTIIFDRGIETAHLQVNQPARIQSCSIVWLQRKCLVAVRKCRLQVAEYCANPATPIPNRFQIWRKTNGLVIVPCLSLIVVTLLIDLGAIGESPSVVRLKLDRLAASFTVLASVGRLSPQVLGAGAGL